MTILEQLVKVYQEEEDYHSVKLSEEESYKYFKKLMDKDRIHTVTSNGELMGYIESWRVSFEQFGRLICQHTFSAYKEDVETGNIAYLSDIWIRQDERHGITFQILQRSFRKLNKDCEYWVGEARRKKCEPVKVFKRKGIFKEEGER